MALQLTPEQERRIQAVVSAGAYRSAEEALNAALAVVETAAAPDFEGTKDELEALLLDGLGSGEPMQADDAFWSRLRAETGRIAAEHRAPRLTSSGSSDITWRTKAIRGGVSVPRSG